MAAPFKYFDACMAATERAHYRVREEAVCTPKWLQYVAMYVEIELRDHPPHETFGETALDWACQPRLPAEPTAEGVCRIAQQIYSAG